MSDANRDIAVTGAKGAIGTASAAIAHAAPLLASVPPWVNDATMWLGLLVAAATLVSFVLDIVKKVQHRFGKHKP